MQKINKNGNKELQSIKRKIVKVLIRHNIKRAGIFGSFVRGEQKKNSDIDVLIKPSKDMSLLGFVGLKFELEDSLGRDVDIVEYVTINPRIKKRILQEELRLI